VRGGNGKEAHERAEVPVRGHPVEPNLVEF
jgi:hypothetical protein